MVVPCGGRFGVRGMENRSGNHDGVEAKPKSRQFREAKGIGELIGRWWQEEDCNWILLMERKFSLLGLAKSTPHPASKLDQVPTSWLIY